MKPFALALALSACLLAGCAQKWTSQEKPQSDLAADKAFCRDYARERIAVTYGFDRYTRVDQDFQIAANYLHNYDEDMQRQNLFEQCLKERGWIPQ